MIERFVFDGVTNDEYGIICVTFEPSSLTKTDSQISDIETEKSVKGDVFHIISQEYSEPLTYTMQVINRDYSPITSVQERALKKWLCRKGKYRLFSVLDKRFADIWFYVNFSNPKTLYVADTVGLEFTITTNAPFGFSDLRNVKWEMDANDYTEYFYVDNDEELPIYPVIKITMKEAGTLTLTNESIQVDDDGEYGEEGSRVENTMTIENCVKDEVITIDCTYPDIYSSVTTHKVFDDFNKFWPYLIDGYNNIRVDKACTLELEYREYRMVAMN